MWLCLSPCFRRGDSSSFTPSEGGKRGKDHAFLVAEAGLVVRRDWLWPGLAVSATGLLTVGLLLVAPPLWVDGLVTLGVCVGLWWMYRPAARRAISGGSAISPEMMASSHKAGGLSGG